MAVTVTVGAGAGVAVTVTVGAGFGVELTDADGEGETFCCRNLTDLQTVDFPAPLFRITDKHNFVSDQFCGEASELNTNAVKLPE